MVLYSFLDIEHESSENQFWALKSILICFRHYQKEIDMFGEVDPLKIGIGGNHLLLLKSSNDPKGETGGISNINI